MDPGVLTLLESLYRFGQDNDAQNTERPRRMLNITPETGRLLFILVRLARATRILEVG
jgi:predicted O-methyltransferase YrrM